MPKLKILVIQVLYIHTGISLLHLRPACGGRGVTGQNRAWLPSNIVFQVVLIMMD